MRGPKENCKLQKSVKVADGMGGWTETWKTVAEFNAVFVPLKMSEKVFFGKDTVFANYRLMVGNKAIDSLTRNEMKEANRIKIGTRTFDIVSVADYHSRHWELALLEIK